MSLNVFAERDANTQPAAARENEKPGPVEYRGQMLENKLSDQKSEKPKFGSRVKKIAQKLYRTYISPSDGILSPATQKLAAFKSKHIAKGPKPRSLFATATTKNAENAGSNGRVCFKEIQQNAENENTESSAS